MKGSDVAERQAEKKSARSTEFRSAPSAERAIRVVATSCTTHNNKGMAATQRH